MGFRTVVVNSRCKLEFRLNYMVVRGETEKRIFIREISTLIVQSTAVSLTAALLCELTKNDVKVIFCDEKCNPQTELLPYYGAHNTPKRYKQQFGWKEETKRQVWQTIVKRKILNQSQVLRSCGFLEECGMLERYINEVQPGDISNREGHAAKVYFNCMMPENTGRHSGGFINGCLNYGYSVLLSALNREISASGYLTQIGIWHDNEFNRFNLACDMIEPLRTIVDRTAFSLKEDDVKYKLKLADILNFECEYSKCKTTLDIAIRSYVRSVLNAINADDTEMIEFPENVIIRNE